MNTVDFASALVGKRNRTFIEAFMHNHPLELRQNESRRMANKYPDRIPVIVDIFPGSDLPTISKRKFLVPNDLHVGQFIHVIRKNIKLGPQQAIFLHILKADGTSILPPTGMLMSQIHSEYGNQDGFTYLVYTGENTFGAR